MDACPDSVTGEDAKNWDAVSLSSFKNVNLGELTFANAATGSVEWKDRAGEGKSTCLGEHAIRIVRKR